MGNKVQGVNCTSCPSLNCMVEEADFDRENLDGVVFVQGLGFSAQDWSQGCIPAEEAVPLRAAGSSAFGEDAEVYSVGNEYTVVSSVGAKGRNAAERTSGVIGILPPGLKLCWTES